MVWQESWMSARILGRLVKEDRLGAVNAAAVGMKFFLRDNSADRCRKNEQVCRKPEPMMLGQKLS